MNKKVKGRVVYLFSPEDVLEVKQKDSKTEGQKDRMYHLMNKKGKGRVSICSAPKMFWR